MTEYDNPILNKNIDPQPLLCFIDHPYMEIHIDKHNKLFMKFIRVPGSYYPLKCHSCNKQISYYYNFIGVTCTTKECHERTMKHSLLWSNNNNNNK